MQGLVKNSILAKSLIFVILCNLFSKTYGQLTNQQTGNTYFLYKDPLGVMVNYTGSIELGNVPHGFGVGIFLDENPTYTYTGEWRHGLATGFGKIQYANGDTYTGKKNISLIYCFHIDKQNNY